jgi:hypothetical protein
MLNLDLCDREFKLLCDTYATNVPGRFGYREFLGDIEQLSRMMAPVQSHSKPSASGSHGCIHTETQLQIILGRIRDAVQHHRISLRDYLLDFDHLRKGHVTKTALACVFTVLRINVKSGELDLLAISYPSIDEWRVDYESLCRGIAAPATTGPSPPGSTLTTPSLTLLGARLRRHTKTRGIRLLSHFRNYDKHNVWFVSGDQFHRVVSALGYVISKAELVELCAEYCSDYPRNERFDYPAFIKAMEEGIDN